jgi:hypothetical protein
MFQELLLHQLFALILSNHFRVRAKTVFFTPSQAIIHELTAASQMRLELISGIDFAREVMPAGCLPKN